MHIVAPATPRPQPHIDEFGIVAADGQGVAHL
jgi:hypothetical protein